MLRSCFILAIEYKVTTKKKSAKEKGTWDNVWEIQDQVSKSPFGANNTHFICPPVRCDNTCKVLSVREVHWQQHPSISQFSVAVKNT
jgi:hypothetical protein